MKNRRDFLAPAIVMVALGWFSLLLKAADPPFIVVMSGLDNPRGLALGADGSLYVAEAGRGGAGPCRFVRGQQVCYGPTGALSRLRHGFQQRIVTGLPSYAPANGTEATGPHDVSLRAGRVYVIVGLGGDPALREAFNPDFGWLLRIRPQTGAWARVADIAGYDFDVNPGGANPADSNPYALLDGAGGRIVVDAGGNDLLSVAGDGEISTLAIFPSRPQGRGTDAVPTSVALGPDGALYVGELTGVPFTPGQARVYRVVPGQEPQVFLEGFTAIIDLAFGPDGSLYVLQYATGPGLSGPGALIRVTPDGTRTVIASADLFHPTSVVLGQADDDQDDEGDVDHHHGAGGDSDSHGDDEGRLVFYISNCGTCAGTGEVIRIRP